MAELREEELRQQIIALKAASRTEPANREDNSGQSFWGQPFSKEIDEAMVPANFRELLIDPFDGTQDPMPIYKLSTHRCTSAEAATDSVANYSRWMATLPPRSIHTCNDLARLFLSKFAANKTKKLEVADLFDFKQARGESLCAGPFSDALALRRSASMEEIRVRAEKHIEVEEDQAERMKADNMHLKGKQVEEHPKQNHARVKQAKHHFTPLTERKAQILKEICHTRLLKFPQEPEGKVLGRHRREWCDFHRTHGHSTEACWTLRTQIEQLVQEGRLNRYIHKKIPGNPRRGEEDDSQHQRRSDRDSGGRPRSRSRDNIPDEPMVISVVAAEYKVERVLVDQGSSANIL
ncbi:hypothetical protein CR513_15295, partial [Mucuna pruriens]